MSFASQKEPSYQRKPSDPEHHAWASQDERRPVYHETMAAGELRAAYPTEHGGEYDSLVQRTENLALGGISIRAHDTQAGPGAYPQGPEYTSPEIANAEPDPNFGLNSAEWYPGSQIYVDPDDVSDDELEVQIKRRFTITKAENLFHAGEWSNAEGFIRASIKIFEDQKYLRRDTAAKQQSRRIFITRLLTVLGRREKWLEAQKSFRLLTLTDMDEMSLEEMGIFDYWHAFVDYKIGDLGSAKFRCETAVRVLRKTGHKHALHSIKLLVKILDQLGDEVEKELYQSSLPSADKPPGSLSIQKQAHHQSQPDTRPAFLNRFYLWIAPDGKTIEGSDEYLVKAIHEVLATNDLASADLLFSDPKVLQRRITSTSQPPRQMAILHTAISYNTPEMVRILLEKGADVFVKSAGWYDSMSLALSLKNLDPEIIGLLGSAGYPLKGTVEAPNRPLEIACQYNRDNSRIKALLANGVDINARNSSGQTALMYSCRLPHLKLSPYKPPFGFLLDWGANLNLVDDRGDTALHILVKCFTTNRDKHPSDESYIRMFLQYGVDVNIKNKDGYKAKDFCTNRKFRNIPKGKS